MTTGMSDYQKIIRPRHGAAHSEIGVVSVVASAETEIISVAGRGVIYGGALHLTHDSDQRDSIPVLEIDGENIAELNFLTLRIYNMTVEGSYPFYLLRYDTVNYQYAVGISSGITFEKGFRVLYQEEYAVTPWVVCRAIYALI